MGSVTGFFFEVVRRRIGSRRICGWFLQVIDLFECVRKMVEDVLGGIKCRIAITKAALNKTRALFTGTLDLELRKKLVKCYIWSIVLYGAETGTLRTVDQKQLECFEMWCWRRMAKDQLDRSCEK